MGEVSIPFSREISASASALVVYIPMNFHPFCFITLVYVDLDMVNSVELVLINIFCTIQRDRVRGNINKRQSSKGIDTSI
jgi:hypothetical protein